MGFLFFCLFSVCFCGSFREFHLELSDVWSAPDGYPRSTFMFNKTIPGPQLEAEEGDTVQVILHNRLMDRTSSFHVHGFVFEQQPWQDGVAMITQCPILPGSHYMYRFLVQNKPGTYWYHSHVGAQVGDGAFGAFIVRPKVRKRETVSVFSHKKKRAF